MKQSIYLGGYLISKLFKSFINNWAEDQILHMNIFNRRQMKGWVFIWLMRCSDRSRATRFGFFIGPQRNSDKTSTPVNPSLQGCWLITRLFGNDFPGKGWHPSSQTLELIAGSGSVMCNYSGSRKKYNDFSYLGSTIEAVRHEAETAAVVPVWYRINIYFNLLFHTDRQLQTTSCYYQKVFIYYKSQVCNSWYNNSCSLCCNLLIQGLIYFFLNWTSVWLFIRTLRRGNKSVITRKVEILKSNLNIFVIRL